MTDTPEIDYEAAFKDLITLGRIFQAHNSYTLPTLDRSRFAVQSVDNRDIIIHSLNSGVYFRTMRNFRLSQDCIYSCFELVEPEERTHVEWVRSAG